jgi:hypothetical protein
MSVQSFFMPVVFLRRKIRVLFVRQVTKNAAVKVTHDFEICKVLLPLRLDISWKVILPGLAVGAWRNPGAQKQRGNDCFSLLEKPVAQPP